MSIRSAILGLQEETVNYTCGHCGVKVAGVVVAKYDRHNMFWLACPSCLYGSASNFNTIVPTPLLGDDVKGLPETIQHAYTEARKTFSFECYTACNLLCRKILMNVAVDKGAPEGKGFAQYIDYMSEEGHVANAMRQWVDKIKDSGNEATHKIDSSDSKSTETTLTFTTILLKNLYEAPFRMKSTSKEST